MPSSVPRIGRLLDLAALLLFLIGAGVYGRAWLGFRELRRDQPVSEIFGEFVAMGRFNDFWTMSRTGMWLMAAGGAVALLAAAVARIRAGD